MNYRLFLLPLLVVAFCCRDDATNPGKEDNSSDWRNSEYVLPYPVGTSYRVSQGDNSGYGLRGNTGNTGGFRHLHFHVSPCDEPVYNNCGTILVRFRNTEPNPDGLLQGKTYKALPY